MLEEQWGGGVAAGTSNAPLILASLLLLATIVEGFKKPGKIVLRPMAETKRSQALVLRFIA
jgi:hypothetical protein